MFDRELDYYGITSAEGITDQESLAKTMDSFILPFDQAKTKHNMFFLAVECYYQFGQGRLNYPNGDSVGVTIGKDHKLYNRAYVEGEERKLFDEYLERYFGLMVSSGTPPRRDGYTFNVCTKKGRVCAGTKLKQIDMYSSARRIHWFGHLCTALQKCQTMLSLIKFLTYNVNHTSPRNFRLSS